MAQGCTPEGPWGNEPSAPEGTASETLGTAYCILNAHTDLGTIHFQGPDWILDSAEGIGPQQLELHIAQYLLPTFTTTNEIKPSPDAIAHAVGYSITERRVILSQTIVPVDVGAFRRVEAYATYQRTVWEIRDASCTTPLGVGTSFNPVGIHFRILQTRSVALPDLGVYAVDGPPGATPILPALPPLD